MPGPSGEKCATCYYFAEGRSGFIRDETDNCRRYPAAVPTYYDHWCGEWRPKERKKGGEPPQ
ncbi:MAG: hypothetical protein IH577_04660 [Deltaproteobacteria bacterium]|nr:hypothetical protein [Deltaproteobacteria bacterium]